ncbi:hypothetical protein FS837_010726 [Tulasnella sp. UAMH 9824]|nr:hypothetical protein FS837_010726 [Tulasnella sp. UAMH 9824]
MREIYGLRRVSKPWKELIEHTPWFWTYISADYPTSIIQECLRLSRHHFLRITISSSCPSWDSWFEKSPTDLIPKLQLLQPHAERWVTLDYKILERSSVDGHRIRDFLESPAPNLKKLVAILPDTMRSGPATLNLAGGKANQMKHLRLENVLLPWSSQLLTGLETFRLSVDSAVSVESIVNIFINCPGLRSFDFSYRIGEGQNIPTLPPLVDPNPSQITAADALEEVSLCFGDPGIASRILSQVSMPVCRSLKLVAKQSRAIMNDIHWQHLNEALSQFSPKIGDAISKAGRAALYIWPDSPWEWTISSEEEAFQFSLDFSLLSLDRFIECARNLASASASELEFEVYLGPTSDRWIPAELGEWSEITKLHVASAYQARYDDGDEEPMFPGYLGQVQMNPVPGLSWPFPNLQELDISDLECPLLKIFDMLNRRYLPDLDVQRMEDLQILVDVPPELDIRVQSTLEWQDSIIVPAIESHRGVKSLEYGSSES